MSKESIVDSSRPSAGRIYDYLLGGHHNFEVDRTAAEGLRAKMPFLPNVMKLQRWCLQDLAVELTEVRGFDVIIDFASGLPTNDHIHHIVPKGTTVIYSDVDPVVVEYAHEILKDTPNVHFFLADAGRPEELLERPEVQKLLAGRRDVAVNYWGIPLFLTDDEIRHAAQALHRWLGAHSCWVFNAQGANSNTGDGDIQRVIDQYQKMGQNIYMRTLDEYRDLIHPWHADKRGFVRLLDWHGFDDSVMSEKDRIQVGEGTGGYGAYLLK